LVKNRRSLNESISSLIRATISSDLVIETLADLEHRQWANWFKTQHLQEAVSRDITLDDGGDKGIYKKKIFVKANEDLERWERQADMSYSDLSDREKDEDRKWAIGTIKAIIRCLFPPNNPEVKTNVQIDTPKTPEQPQ
jgi:hypothetical protein